MLRRRALLLSGDPITLGRFTPDFRDLSPTLGVLLIAQAPCRIFSHGSLPPSTANSVACDQRWRCSKSHSRSCPLCMRKYDTIKILS
jgi:hypothetical protein